MAERAQTRNDITILEASIQSLLSAAHWVPTEGSAIAARTRLLEAQLMVMKGDYRAAREAAKEAAELAMDVGLATVLAKARLTEAWVWNWMGTGTLAEHEAISVRAIEAARRAGDPSAEIEARQIKANVAFGAGQLDKFVADNLDLLADARSIGDKARAASILERLAAVENVIGHNELGTGYIAEAERIAAELGLRDIRLQIIRFRALERLRAGDLAASEILSRQVIETAAEAGAVQLHISGCRFLAQTLLLQHRADEAAAVLDSGIALSESTGEGWNRAELLGMRARAALELGEVQLADTFIDRALTALRAWDITGISEVQQHLGWIRAAQGRYADAEAALRQSYEVVAPTGYRWLSVVAAAELARFHALRGAAANAQDLVDRWEPAARDGGWRLMLDAFQAVRGSIATTR
jgi:tetratricopeptide (TPR) repeat protein